MTVNISATMIVLLVLRHVWQGFHKITVILDNATICGSVVNSHRQQMLKLSAGIAEILAWTGFKNINLAFLHAPYYLPAFNLAEYLILLIHQDALHRLSRTLALQDKAKRVQEHLAQGPPDTRTNAEPHASYRKSTYKLLSTFKSSMA